MYSSYCHEVALHPTNELPQQKLHAFWTPVTKFQGPTLWYFTVTSSLHDHYAGIINCSTLKRTEVGWSCVVLCLYFFFAKLKSIDSKVCGMDTTHQCSKNSIIWSRLRMIMVWFFDMKKEWFNLPGQEWIHFYFLGRAPLTKPCAVIHVTPPT
jgi:hypothetical protein